MRKLLIAIATLAVVIVCYSFSDYTTHAEPVDSLKNKQSKVKDEREEVKKNLSDANAKIADLLLDLKELNEEIALVDEALKHNKKMVKETEENIKQSEKEISVLEDEITKLEDDIEIRNDILKQRLSSLQKNGGSVAYLEVLFGAKTFMDFISRVSTIATITNNDIDLIEKQEEDKQLVVSKHDEVEQRLNEQKDQKVELEGMNLLILDQQKENKKKKKTLQNKEKKLTALKGDLEDKDNSLASLEAQIRRDIAAARSPQRPQTSVASNNNNLVHLSSPTTPKGSGSLSTVINAGYRHYGVPYRTAGKTPAGFDCSGFVSWAFAQGGYSIPSSTEGLRVTGHQVSYSNIQPGDLVFFNTYKRDGHVGIYIGNGKFIGSQNSTGLAEASMNSTYWSNAFKGHVRRIR